MTRAIRCGTLFDGTGADPVRDAVVLVSDGRITSVGAVATTAIPSGAEIVDLRDRFVMPGLIDAHSHISIVPGMGDQIGQLRQAPVPQALRATANIRRDLFAGTTTMRVMSEENFLDLDVRAAIDAGVIPGPRLLCGTRGITASNGHGRVFSAFDGVDEIRRGVRGQSIFVDPQSRLVMVHTAVRKQPGNDPGNREAAALWQAVVRQLGG